MHQLFLLRHARAEPAGTKISDHDRPLTPEGRLDAGKIAKAMRTAGLAPDVVLVSTATRTQQTLEMLEQHALWDEWPNIDALPQLYMATPPQILNTLRDLPETVRSVLVVAHNPGLHMLALQLAGEPKLAADFKTLQAGYPTATLSEFLVTGTWRHLGADGASSLQRLFLAQS